LERHKVKELESAENSVIKEMQDQIKSIRDSLKLD
jgi:DNA-binding transcriptional regulator YiaG